MGRVQNNSSALGYGSVQNLHVISATTNKFKNECISTCKGYLSAMDDTDGQE